MQTSAKKKLKECHIDLAILKINFARIDEIKDQELQTKVTSKIAEKFPARTMSMFNEQKITMNAQGPQFANTESMKQWEFMSAKGGSRVIINPDSLTIEAKNNEYISFENFSTSFNEIADVFFSVYKIPYIERLGVRYVNLFESKENLYDWSNVIKSDYSSMVPLEGRKSLVRAIAIVEKNDAGDHNTRIQYGLFNRDYPSINVRNEFLIDTDVYYDGIIYQKDMKDKISEFHDIAEENVVNMVDDCMLEIVEN